MADLILTEPIKTLLDADTLAAFRTALGLDSAALQPSSAFQPNDADLTAIAALTTTPFGRGLLTLASAAAAAAAIVDGQAIAPASVASTGAVSGTTGAFGLGRPVMLENGAVSMMGSAGGWAMPYGFKGSAGTGYGGLFGFGSSDTMDWYCIGPAYDAGLLVDHATGNVTATGSLTVATTPVYANDAAADADTALPSGGLYKITGNRAIYQKP